MRTSTTITAALLLGTAILAGCASAPPVTGYDQPWAPNAGGFSRVDVVSGTDIMIDASGSSATPMEDVREQIMLKAAEVAMQHHYTHVSIYEGAMSWSYAWGVRDERVDTTVTTGKYSAIARTTYTPGGSYIKGKQPQGRFRFVMTNGQPVEGAQAPMSAAAICQQYGQKYHAPCALALQPAKD